MYVYIVRQKEEAGPVVCRETDRVCSVCVCERERERRGREVEALDLLLEFAEILGVVLDIE